MADGVSIALPLPKVRSPTKRGGDGASLPEPAGKLDPCILCVHVRAAQQATNLRLQCILAGEARLPLMCDRLHTAGTHPRVRNIVAFGTAGLSEADV